MECGKIFLKPLIKRKYNFSFLIRYNNVIYRCCQYQTIYTNYNTNAKPCLRIHQYILSYQGTYINAFLYRLIVIFSLNWLIKKNMSGQLSILIEKSHKVKIDTLILNICIYDRVLSLSLSWLGKCH